MANEVHSVTFVATSNDVKPVAPRKQAEPLGGIMLHSHVAKEAFRKTRDVTTADKVSPIIIQSSKSDHDVMEAKSGLVSAIQHAYNWHHHLILRPDDVWQAILTQFSFYVNANAEALRDRFVDFQGKKTLVIEVPENTLFSTNFGTFANRMVDEQITKNLKHPEVTKWLLPDFSTTTANDRVAASITMMSTLKIYFEHWSMSRCGIPKVTMQGSVEDWKVLRKKIDRLVEYDLEENKVDRLVEYDMEEDKVGRLVEFDMEENKVMSQWHALLAPVLDQFVLSVEGQPSLDFWNQVVHRDGEQSGISYLSGWVTVFACFEGNGHWHGYVPKVPPKGFGYEVDEFGFEMVDEDGLPVKKAPWTPKWPFIDTVKLPVGAVSVPVNLDDNGVQYEAQMLAGQFAFANDANTVCPRTDWCIAYKGKPREVPIDYKHGEIVPLKNP